MVKSSAYGAGVWMQIWSIADVLTNIFGNIQVSTGVCLGFAPVSMCAWACMGRNTNIVSEEPGSMTNMRLYQ